jgi:putative membrane protein
MSRLTRSLPILGAAAVIGIGSAGATALANGDHHGSGHHHGKYSAWDEQWLQSAIEGDLFEIQGGKVAQQQAASQQVKDYGARLVADHTKSLQDATALAKRLGIEVPTAPTPEQQVILQMTAKLQGDAFDAAYVDAEAKDHQQDISEATDEAQDGFNRAVRKDAAQEIPTLKEHLAIAERLGGKQGQEPLPSSSSEDRSGGEDRSGDDDTASTQRSGTHHRRDGHR